MAIPLCIMHSVVAYFNKKIFLQSIRLYMNGSQLLYKISNLQHSIRMKKVEYVKALNAGDQINIDLSTASLKLLKEDLAVTVKAFNAIPAYDADNSPKSPKKIRWWQNIFNWKTIFSRK